MATLSSNGDTNSTRTSIDCNTNNNNNDDNNGKAAKNVNNETSTATGSKQSVAAAATTETSTSASTSTSTPTSTGNEQSLRVAATVTSAVTVAAAAIEEGKEEQEAARVQGLVPAAVREIFAAMDPEGSGRVGFSAFLAACLAGRPADEAGARVAFGWLDRRQKEAITVADVKLLTGEVRACVARVCVCVFLLNVRLTSCY